MNILSTIARQLSVLYPEGEARAMARCIVEDRFCLSPTDVAQGKDSDLSADDKEDLQNIVDRLLQNEPLQYVLGSTLFCGHRFNVRPGCLIPRPETEDLVHTIIDDLKDTSKASVLDIGTGSGCIAVSLALSTSTHFDVTAWDESKEALDIANENARMLNADVKFELRDIANIGNEIRQWDIIVSNPPYVCQEEAAQMERNVLDYEPKIALFVPDDNPLVFYHFIGAFAISHLCPAGSLYVEINHRFGKECTELFRRLGFADVSIRQDRYGKDRIIKCQL